MGATRRRSAPTALRGAGHVSGHRMTGPADHSRTDYLHAAGRARKAQGMTAQLKITTELIDGSAETLTHTWLGWDVDVAASITRAKRHVVGGGMTYDLPLGDRHREAGIVRVTHEWTDTDWPLAERVS